MSRKNYEDNKNKLSRERDIVIKFNKDDLLDKKLKDIYNFNKS
jgi:hypothetical protein